MRFLAVLVGPVYFVMRIVQMSAIADGLAGTLHTPQFISFLGAFVLTWLPVIGPLLGGYSAAVAWGWPFLGAALFFASPLLAFNLIAALVGLFDDMTSWLRGRLFKSRKRKAPVMMSDTGAFR